MCSLLSVPFVLSTFSTSATTTTTIWPIDFSPLSPPPCVDKVDIANSETLKGAGSTSHFDIDARDEPKHVEYFFASDARFVRACYCPAFFLHSAICIAQCQYTVGATLTVTYTVHVHLCAVQSNLPEVSPKGQNCGLYWLRYRWGWKYSKVNLYRPESILVGRWSPFPGDVATTEGSLDCSCTLWWMQCQLYT